MLVRMYLDGYLNTAIIDTAQGGTVLDMLTNHVDLELNDAIKSDPHADVNMNTRVLKAHAWSNSCTSYLIAKHLKDASEIPRVILLLQERQKIEEGSHLYPTAEIAIRHFTNRLGA